MSIFGERIRRPGPDIGTILSDYARKDYVDAQDALRVLKAGDTMTGDLDMGGQLVRGLPKNLRDYKSDEATSWNQITKTVAMRKPVITIWAEQNGPLTAGNREWSFGDSANGTSRYIMGYPMVTKGRILSASLATSIEDRSNRPEAIVSIMINWRYTGYTVRRPAQSDQTSVTYVKPLEVGIAKLIGFRTETTNPEVKTAVISLLIELDL